MVHRAWIELNTSNLAYNLQIIKEYLPINTELMAVVKANAYGHGSQEIAKELQKLGVSAVAVATLYEAIEIRKAGYQNDILILSFTPIEESFKLTEWNLIQNVIDYPYAKELNSSGGVFRVHIKVDTGMNRLGEKHWDVPNIKAIFNLKNLKVEGIYSHFSRSDTLDASDIEFTLKQVHRFNELLEQLKMSGIELPKTHIQNSYGMLNYPHLQYDYARIGTLIYGIRSHYNTTKLQLPLRPVLSIRTKIIIIKDVQAGDTIGYDKANTTDVDKKIAVLPIGFADGIPEKLSQKQGEALVRGHRVPIIGSVCLDHMMIDLTNVDDVQVGDIVTLVGTDLKETIHIEDVAVKIGTVSHDVLSTLGPRLKRVTV
ncbi:serine racemase VanT catalytic subunit [Ureibacillus aquaedulcis]|uniref:Alanine racemase n=1 Tax=Ureibacillus aquaedulcis TaxID=3058421 RepID=A0ABT8GKS5_9BACL|nr:serine racemase VanT catalytic subunit [Ureibacillus sp. BA0131]MDN4492021.1 serine racemase VanT catalytic subunit [Ureibacillus sp. BA0131]